MIATHRAEAAHLFRRVGAPTSEILSAESAHRGCRDAGCSPTRRALYSQKSGPKWCTEHLWGCAPPWSRLLDRPESRCAAAPDAKLNCADSQLLYNPLLVCKALCLPRPPRRTSPITPLLSREAFITARDGISGWVDDVEKREASISELEDDAKDRSLMPLASGRLGHVTVRAVHAYT